MRGCVCGLWSVSYEIIIFASLLRHDATAKSTEREGQVLPEAQISSGVSLFASPTSTSLFKASRVPQKMWPTVCDCVWELRTRIWSRYFGSTRRTREHSQVCVWWQPGKLATFVSQLVAVGELVEEIFWGKGIETVRRSRSQQ